MGKSVKEMLDEFKKRKNLMHQEETEERYMTDVDPRLYSISKPANVPDGKFEVVKKHKKEVFDKIDDKDINTVILLEQEKILNDINRSIEGTLSSIKKTQEEVEGHLRIIKGIGIFFIVLTIIGLVFTIIQAVSISSLI